MKITCAQQDLNRGLSIVGRAVSTRSTLPILANILVTAEGDRIRLSATNLEIGITCGVAGKIEREGSTTVPARLLSEFVGALPPGDVTLDLQEGGSQSLKVKSQRSQATIRGMDASEFPTIPAAEGGEQPIELNAQELGEMIREVTFAAATDDARPVFTGVLARVRDDRVTFAAADSFRLAVRTAALPAADGGGVATAVGDVLVPARTLNELAKVLPDEGQVRMVVTPNRNQVLFTIDDGDVEIVSNLIAGQFPNFEAILPKSSSTRVVLPTDDFRQAARTAAIFARDSANIVRLKVTAGGEGGLMPGSVTLEATAEDTGDATTTLNNEVTVDGEGMEIIFNVKYLTDVLGVVGTPQVALELSSPQHPGVVKPVGEHASDYVYVIMPMHSTR